MEAIPFNDQYFSIVGNSGAQIQIRFRDLVELVNEGIYCINNAGLVVFANDRFSKLLGYTNAELIGKSVFEMVHGEENVRVSKAKLDLRKKGITDSYDILCAKKTARVSGYELTANRL